MSTKIYIYLLIFVSGLMVSEATRGRYKQRVPHFPGVSRYHRPRVFTKHYAPVMKPNINNPPSLHASVVQKADYTKPEDVPATKPETLSWLNKSKDKLKSATNSIKDVYKAKIEDKFQPAMSTTRFGFKSLKGVSDTVSAVDNINNFGLRFGWWNPPNGYQPYGQYPQWNYNGMQNQYYPYMYRNNMISSSSQNVPSEPSDKENESVENLTRQAPVSDQSDPAHGIFPFIQRNQQPQVYPQSMMGAYNLPFIPYFVPTSPMNLQNDINMMQYYNNIPSMPMYSGLNNNYNMMTKAHDSLFLNNMPMDHRTADTVPNKVLAGNTDDKLVPNNNINVMMISQTPVAPNNIRLGYTDENKSAVTTGIVTENDGEVVVKNETSTVKYDENVATADVTNTLKMIKI